MIDKPMVSSILSGNQFTLEYEVMLHTIARILATGLTLALVVSLGPSAVYGGTQGEDTQQFGGDFDSLDPEQQRLVEDWIQRFNRIMGENREAEATYNSLPMASSSFITSLNFIM